MTHPSDCRCACHSGGAFPPPCSLPGGCGSTQGPLCVYPDCEETTLDVMCDSSRSRYRRILDLLVMDYAAIKHTMPLPTKAKVGITGNLRTYGHPAEGASDLTADIAGALNWIEDDLRNYLGHAPPPHPRVEEHRLVRHAHRYLADRFHDLCTFPAALEAADEIVTLQRKCQAMIGHVQLPQRLKRRCQHCQQRSVMRTDNTVWCDSCNSDTP